MLTLWLMLGAVLGAVVWDKVKQAEWFPWESEEVKSLRLERDGYKQRLDDVVVALDAEKDVLALLEARRWNVFPRHKEQRYSRYASFLSGPVDDLSSPRGWVVNDHWHKTLVGAYRKAIIAHDAGVRLKEELGKVE